MRVLSSPWSTSWPGSRVSRAGKLGGKRSSPLPSPGCRGQASIKEGGYVLTEQARELDRAAGAWHRGLGSDSAGLGWSPGIRNSACPQGLPLPREHTLRTTPWLRSCCWAHGVWVGCSLQAPLNSSLPGPVPAEGHERRACGCKALPRFQSSDRSIPASVQTRGQWGRLLGFRSTCQSSRGVPSPPPACTPVAQGLHFKVNNV